LEYNKVELLENDTCLSQNSAFEEEFEYQLVHGNTLEQRHKDHFKNQIPETTLAN